ncbi:MAG TPA: EAL domain-containing protein [Steroidobacteraceae bacterium]|nr:EAL domain-containing protein [Steroidobacteraceae bacterium]
MPSANVLLVSAQPADKARVAASLAAIRGQPYRLEVASTLAEALARLRHGRVDAILLDLNLPDSTGLTTFLRTQPKATQVPIVVLVGEDQDDTGPDAVQRGALDFLVREQLTAPMIERVLRYATERTHTLLALKASEQRYRELFQNVTAGVFQTTFDGKFMAANPALVRMLGYDSEDELLELDISRDVYMEPDHRQNWVHAMQQDGEVRNAELVLKRKDGSKIVVLENSRAVRDAEGKVLFYEGTLTDITAAHELSQQLSYDASHDALTGLANRREFELRLQRALEMTQATGAEHAVLFLDLDRFKAVNDSCGHVAGDELLRQLGEVLPARIRAADVIARLGGDEFAVLLHNCALQDALQVGQALLKSVHGFEFIWGAHRFSLGVSIGVVVLDARFKRIAQVLNAADSACYQAKDAGRNRLVVYQEDAPALQQRHGEMGWVTRAKRALVENQLFLEAQLIQPLGPGPDGAPRLPHYELFVRMRDESGRVVPPGAFLPAVERYNLAVRYDRWVIGAALGWARDHARLFDRVARLFINLTRDSVVDAETGDFVRQLLATTGVDPAHVGFETAESVAIGNLGKANQLIGALRRAGCAFALDDFGSSVSSFAYIKALGADYLKIDGMFVGNLSQDRVDYAMVRSIKDIGHVMGKQVIAKSVESEAVLQKLREIGVDYAQGFAVGTPKPLEEIGSVSVADLLA